MITTTVLENTALHWIGDFMMMHNQNPLFSTSSKRHGRQRQRRLELKLSSKEKHQKHDRIKVFSVLLDHDHPIARKQRKDIAALAHVLDHVLLNLDQQREYLATTMSSSSNMACGGSDGGITAMTRFDDLVHAGHSHLATEVWKYCALYQHGGVYVDSSSPLLESLDHLIALESTTTNKAVLIHDDSNVAASSSFPHSIHGSFLYLSQPHTAVAKGMLQALFTTPLSVLTKSPLLLPQTLYRLIQQDLPYDIHPGPSNDPSQGKWYFLEQKCTINPVRTLPQRDATVSASSSKDESR
jgi:hypothetical protein